MKQKVVVAGATGFVGRALINQIKDEYECIGLTRGEGFEKENVKYNQCDLFSYESTLNSLKNADIAVYLIHSMLPKAGLVQATFNDLDLWLAENFAKAAELNGVKHIIYLGGILPHNQSTLSLHLESRLEVENVFRSYSTPFTALRAGLIIGPSGSSFDIMKKLVDRLPFMLCPSWTQTMSQPIYLEDAAYSIKYCIKNKETINQIYDIGGAELISYQDMMKKTAEIQGKKRYFLSLSVFTPKLSQLWVRLFSGAPKELVYPLIQSLKHSMVVHPDHRLKNIDHNFIGFTEAIKKTLETKTKKNLIKKKQHKPLNNVISIQRFNNINLKFAHDLGLQYFSWLKNAISPFFLVINDKSFLHIYFRLFKKPLLSLKLISDNQHSKTWIKYLVTGGILVSHTNKGSLEFRESLNKNIILICLNNFTPSLPWFIYKFTQAKVHQWVMLSFIKLTLETK